MRFASGPPATVDAVRSGTMPILLYGRSASPAVASAGAAAANTIRRRALAPSPLAWDFLSIALSVVTADSALRRNTSSDGWTREFEIEVTVSDPEHWTPHAHVLEDALRFLTTDVWNITFAAGAQHPVPPKKPQWPDTDCVALLSGGLDSLVGAIDLSTQGEKLLAVSHTVRGDGEKQAEFARIVGAVAHLQVNHNASAPRVAKETSQRSRSFIFLAFAVLAATATERYGDEDVVPIYICENGFIAVNPPLTGSRLGSLSTRTAHPHFLGEIQHLLDLLGFRVELRNPYSEKTKGEMLTGCLDGQSLSACASSSTSCGRYQRYNYKHCGRCIPCQIRRAAFIGAGCNDATSYYYEDLGKLDGMDLDDVRSVAMARLAVEEHGLDRWLGSSLSSPHIRNRDALRSMIQRGLDEIGALHAGYGIS